MSDEAPAPAVVADTTLSPVNASLAPASPTEAAADELSVKLSQEQQRALALLIGGMSIKEAAESAGVSRSTLYRWLEQDDSFAALFNLWKREQFESARVQALALAGAAMKTIGQAIEKGHVPAAIHVAKGLGVLERPRRGETDPELLGRRREVAEARREKKLERDERAYGIRDRASMNTVADCDALIESVMGLRRTLLKNNMDAWARYDRTKDLTAEECSRLNCVKAEGPPDCPRPAEKDLWEMAECHHRKENYFGWDVRGAVEK